MLSTRCGACNAPLPLDRVHRWVGSAALCSAGCVAKAAHPARSAAEHREEALSIIASARRANELVAAMDALWLDRRAAANAIVGLTQGARRRKASLDRQGDEFEQRTEPARRQLESTLARLVGHVMALAEELPAAVDVAVRLASGYPNTAGEAAADTALAELEALLAGASAPPPLRLDVVHDGSRRAERHRDGLALYEAERLTATAGEVQVEKDFVRWSGMALVECIDGDVVVRNAGREEAARVHARDDASRERVLGWVRAERPDMRDAERTMTRGEALALPGCALAALLAVGGAIAGILAFFGASAGWVAGVAALTGLIAILPIVSGARRLATRPIVRQLVSGEPAAERSSSLAAPIGAVQSVRSA